MGNVDQAVTGGGKLATRISGIVVPAIVATHSSLAGVRRNLVAASLDDFFDKVSGEIRHTTGDLYAQLADHAETPAQLRDLFSFLARGNGQWQSIVGGSITGSVISGGLGDIVSNLIAPLGHAIIAGQPNALLSPSDVAAAQARGINIGLPWGTEARQNGLDDNRYAALVELNYNRPDVSTILELLNRGEINDLGARGALLQLGFREGDLDGILSTRRTLLTPAALADMVVRDILSEDQAAAIANQSGLSTEDFHALVLDTGEAPGIQDLLFTYRRGFIDRARLEHGIRQSRLRTEWTDVVESLSLVPMSTADAIEGAVQGALTPEASKAIAAQNGLIAEHWQPLYDIAGNPPGIQQMVSMWHRGKMTLAELVKGIRESRLKDKYIDATIAASPRIPPERSVVSLVSKGSLTEAQGTEQLLMLGYTPEIAAALMANAHAVKTVKAHTLTESMVTTLYEDQAMTAEQATGILTGLGYSDDDAGWLLALADANRAHKYQQAVITRLGSSYVKGLTDEQSVRVVMQGLGIPAAQLDLIVRYWNLEIHTVTKTLTEAQVVKAAKDGNITADQATARLLGMGYGEQDAAILLAPVVGPPPGSPASTGG